LICELLQQQQAPGITLEEIDGETGELPSAQTTQRVFESFKTGQMPLTTAPTQESGGSGWHAPDGTEEEVLTSDPTSEGAQPATPPASSWGNAPAATKPAPAPAGGPSSWGNAPAGGKPAPAAPATGRPAPATGTSKPAQTPATPPADSAPSSSWTILPLDDSPAAPPAPAVPSSSWNNAPAKPAQTPPPATTRPAQTPAQSATKPSQPPSQATRPAPTTPPPATGRSQAPATGRQGQGDMDGGLY
ncbi:MAG: hypothetical protein HQL97_05515, partial [Magnetococcales bacterium]|nr:hypothetical protein [Magnetococcales bacterium]